MAQACLPGHRIVVDTVAILRSLDLADKRAMAFMFSRATWN
jgi:hypothetical protein